MALPLSYNVRNVRVRWQVTLLAIGGIALVVAVFAVLMSMSEGFRRRCARPAAPTTRSSCSAAPAPS